MLQMLFFIRFRGQLRRTRPELITSLEDTVADAAAAAGGSVEIGRKVLSASFDESRIGFWLDIVIFLEKVHKVLQKNSSELYGHSLVLGHNILDMPIQKIGVSLSRESSPGSPGIWCSEEVRSALEQYTVFGKLKEAEETPDRGAVPDGYRELKDFRVFGKNRVEFPFREKIKQILISGTRKNTLLLGPEFLGKRDGIFYYCESILEDVPPLAARFGAGGRGLICFVDAYTKRIRSFISETLPKEIAG
ncbi:MAG: hypothetical protein FWH35_10220, partial [Treponema sp.]|nr:hypothetical protein [Treponema sp.]